VAVDPHLLGECRKEQPRGIADGRGNIPACEILRLADPGFCQGDDAGRRAVVNHEGRGHYRLRVLMVEFDEEIGITVSDVIGAEGYSPDGIAGAGTAIHGDIKPLTFVIVFLDGDREWSVRALEDPIDGKFDGGLRRRAVHRQDRPTKAQRRDQAHVFENQNLHVKQLTDLGFTRDRYIKVRKSAIADLR